MIQKEKIKKLGDLQQQVDDSEDIHFVPSLPIQKHFQKFTDDQEPFPVTVLIERDENSSFEWEELWFDADSERKVRKPDWSAQKESRYRKSFNEHLEQLEKQHHE